MEDVSFLTIGLSVLCIADEGLQRRADGGVCTYDAATAAVDTDREAACKERAFTAQPWDHQRSQAGKAGTKGGDQWADHHAYPENAVSVFDILFASRLDGFADDDEWQARDKRVHQPTAANYGANAG